MVQSLWVLKIQKTILIIKQASQYTVAAGLPQWDADVEHEPRGVWMGLFQAQAQEK